MEEICDTPAEYLASQDPAAACGEEAWQTVGGKGADFFKSSWNVLFIKSCSGLVLYGFLLYYELLLD
ncbi:hypothetical protein [Peribacillus frigoritolerans]|uniref:hypothetical protein n=1 Tax=Peribacillus frigoritolerans TaxID=450367 RepID=UPI0020BE5468|nr:hypothetical protein [Peribacillus frigoritolerans]